MLDVDRNCSSRYDNTALLPAMDENFTYCGLLQMTVAWLTDSSATQLADRAKENVIFQYILVYNDLMVYKCYKLCNT